MEITILQTDSTREEEGVWLNFGDAKVLIGSKGSDRYKKVMQRIFKPHAANYALDLLSEDVAKELSFRGMAEGLILNWDGFTEGGVAVPYSVDKAYEYVKLVKSFFNFVDQEAEKLSNYQKAKEELEVKN